MGSQYLFDLNFVRVVLDVFVLRCGFWPGRSDLFRFLTFLLSLSLSVGFVGHVGLFSVTVGAGAVLPVHNVNSGLNYTSIQDAIDANETVPGNSILVDAGNYAEHLSIDKSISLIGAGLDSTVINGGGAGVVVDVTAGGVSIQGFTVENGLVVGIFLDHSNDSAVTDDRVTGIQGQFYGVYASYSFNCTIQGNIVGPNSASGVLVTNSANFTISSNYAHDNGGFAGGYGLNVNDSRDGAITFNTAVNNVYDGIGLGAGTSSCVVMGNNVSGNQVYGLWIDTDSSGNLIYDNDFIKNNKQVSVTLPNQWDNGVEGNYWSNYTGADINQDGLIDAPFTVYTDNIDHHALAGQFFSYPTKDDMRLNIVSNASLIDFQYFDTNGTIGLDVTNPFGEQGSSFCRVAISHGLIVGPYVVMVNGSAPSYLNSSILDNGESRSIYFSFPAFAGEITIQGLDKTIPRVIISSPGAKTYDTSSIDLIFTVDETPSSMSYSLDGQAKRTVNGNTTISDVSSGNHSIVVYVSNYAGNTGISDVVNFTVNVTCGEIAPFVWAALAVAVVVVVVVSVLVYSRRKRNKPKGPNP